MPELVVRLEILDGKPDLRVMRVLMVDHLPVCPEALRVQQLMCLRPVSGLAKHSAPEENLCPITSAIQDGFEQLYCLGALLTAPVDGHRG